ncbi:MAG: hypothetical protein R2910_13000 [Gemmatimonadales bacterium]
MPPRLDLGAYSRLALVTFSTDPSKNSLGVQATHQFAEDLLASQTGFELLELGPADSLVARLLADGNAPEAAKQVGREKDVAAVFFGELVVSGTKASGSVNAGGNLSVSGTVSAELHVRLLSTSSGGTAWRSSATTSRNVGQVSMSGGKLPSISATDPNAAYAKMVDDLVTQVTRDARPTWVKQ